MTSTVAESSRTGETTVLGAMRRHWLLVSLIVVACVDVAVAYGALQGNEYRATSTVSAPRPAGSALQSDAQYLDSQVLLLNSRRVGDRALEIAQGTPAGASIDREELAPTIGKVEIIPPPSGASGSFGTTIVSIQFTSPSAEEAQAGVNALATAYDEVRSQEISDNAAARLASIEAAIATADSPSDVAALRKERVQALIDQGRDLAQTASVSTAEKPDAPAGSGLLSLLGVGLFLGLVAGGAAAFVRSSRLQHVGESHVPERVYGAPLLYQHRDTHRSPAAVEITEANKLLGRAVAHRLRAFDGPCVLAVVAAPGNHRRSLTAANLAMVLSEGDEPVLAVDGADGTMATMLRPGTSIGEYGGAGRLPARSLLSSGLFVLDISDGGPEDWDATCLEAPVGVVVVDCPPVATSAWAVDLLARCNAAVVLVRADEPVPQHVDVARWLELTETEALGYLFIPYPRRGPLDWWRRRGAEARIARPDVAAGRPAQQSTASTGGPDGTEQSRAASPVRGLPARVSE